MARGVARDRHDRSDVDRHHFVEIREVVVHEATVHGARYACVVDYDVQAAEMLDGRRYKPTDLVEVSAVIGGWRVEKAGRCFADGGKRDVRVHVELLAVGLAGSAAPGGESGRSRDRGGKAAGRGSLYSERRGIAAG